jgi:hypothetical protein
MRQLDDKSSISDVVSEHNKLIDLLSRFVDATSATLEKVEVEIQELKEKGKV